MLLCGFRSNSLLAAPRPVGPDPMMTIPQFLSRRRNAGGRNPEQTDTNSNLENHENERKLYCTK